MHTYLISCDISFYRMMQRQADKAGKKVAFLDPLAIAEKRHKGPKCFGTTTTMISKTVNRARKLMKCGSRNIENHYDSCYVHIASVSRVARRGCHMGTI